MTSSEKILAGIIEEAQTKAEGIIKKAEEDAASLISKEKMTAENDVKTIISEADKKAEIIKATGISSAALYKRDKALMCRSRLIDKILVEMCREIAEYDNDRYFDCLLNLLKKYHTSNEGEIFLNSKDFKRITETFIKEISAFGLRLNETPADIESGFMLKYGDIYINCELKSLVHENHDRLVEIVNSALFKKQK